MTCLLKHGDFHHRQLSFSQRIYNMINKIYTLYAFFPKMYNSQNALFKRMVREDFPDLRHLAQQASVAFVNTLPNIGIARPISSKIVFIGGIVKKQVTVMEKRFTDLYENARKGVVVFSLGSLVDTVKMPKQMKNDVSLAFSRFPDYDFVVKLTVSDEEREKFASSYPNVHFFDWIDQVNILHHPKTKAFITHAGLNSLTEAAFAGTPLICVPMFADQHYNTAISLRKKTGVYLNKKHIDAETMIEALQEVLSDPRPVCSPQKKTHFEGQTVHGKHSSSRTQNISSRTEKLSIIFQYSLIDY
ncbi:unnamed protein product [Gongylonema pulchrum]|uniref:UDP-glucuronosyltransferase n=1 Tax=Gongylonema pulchrum TaxID=637853 RepID=A0A183CZM8_9BILA|nr:unnamed protein product [Gongylonema pulchrum]